VVNLQDQSFYTLYEVEKQTKGRLTKYKLVKAIQDGDLIATEQSPSGKGRGYSKYVISADNLNQFLIQESKKAKAPVNFDIINNQTESIFDKNEKNELQSLKERVRLLEERNQEIITTQQISDQRKKLISQLKSSKLTSTEKDTILTELSLIS
tara:strand:+ start:888 stop:1346 length:459 start_codon:yes stop_codon:yes gene_type:complete